MIADGSAWRVAVVSLTVVRDNFRLIGQRLGRAAMVATSPDGLSSPDGPRWYCIRVST